jgi:hypothetical protein
MTESPQPVGFRDKFISQTPVFVSGYSMGLSAVFLLIGFLIRLRNSERNHF